MIKKIIVVLLCIATLTPSRAASTIADILGWHKSKTPCQHICGGYFEEPAAITAVPQPPAYQTVPVVITAKGPVIFRTNGTSVLQNQVLIRQPGRMITADKAIVFHNRKTGKIVDIQLIGNVRLREAGKLVAGNTADYNVQKNEVIIHHAVFHIAGQHKIIAVTEPFDAWGKAQKANREPNGNLSLEDATFSTCSPENPVWTVSASHLQLDTIKEKGVARNIVLRFYHVPILYSPYYSFSLNARRKSGFLAPSFGYTADHGFYMTQPFYWNMAPNYDLLLTPQWYSLRGLQTNGLFRYLTPHSNGDWYLSFLPNDKEFSQYRQDTLSKYASTVPDQNLSPYINALNTNDNDRAFIDLKNDITFNHRWNAKVYARYASDPYFAEDFPSLFLEQNSDQLPSYAEVNYSGLHWTDTFLVQSYQTLHPIDQYLTPAQNQYTRLPELNFNAAYPQFIPDYNFNMSGQFVRFVYRSAYYPFTYERPVGNRMHLQPSISRPFDWASGYVTPTLTLDSTQYFSRLSTTGSTIPRQEYDVNRALPIFDIDTGWYFDRFIDFRHHHYIQTIEPRLFYLYVPYLNQDEYPNFDTQLLPFSASNLFSLNQFTGYDRLQNANQISLGLMSNIINASNATNILSAEMGFIGYMEDQKVCLLQNCKRIPQSISPITGELTWHPNPSWAFTGQAAWDTALKQVNNAQVGTQYQFQNKEIATLSYEFTHGNPDTPFDSLGFSTNSSLITAGLMWPLTSHWQVFGYDYYDLTHHHAVNQYTGLSYDTCCWAFRVIMATAYTGAFQINNGQTLQNQYDTTYYIQFLLKGLGTAGNREAKSMLTATLPGFEDTFSNNAQNTYNQHF